MDEPRVVVRIPGDAWTALCDREPELAMVLELGLWGGLSDLELVSLLVLHGVPVDRPS